MTDNPIDAADGHAEQPLVDGRVASATIALTPFLERNPKSKVELAELGSGKAPCVVNPWADNSIAIVIDPRSSDLQDALNSVLLPERLSAIYHVDERALEIIWTAYVLAPSQVEISGRNFTFSFEGNAHRCEFSASSEKLLVIAKYAAIAGMTDTNHRNLTSFRDFANGSTEKIDKPLSFWIKDIDWNEDNVLDLIRNLNFYLTYYDDLSPTVLIHTPETATPTPRLRYLHDAVPTVVQGRKLDDVVLHFWHAAKSGDNSRRFLYYYRIIEYASFYYLDQAARASVRRILSTPHAASNVSDITEKVMAAISESKLDEYAKFNAVIRDNVDVKLLWREIAVNPGAFSSATTFDGGFTLGPLIGPTTKEEDFCVKGLENFTKTIRDIRNALSHGRDQKTASVITPTVSNLMLLTPWVHLIAAAAGEVALYKDIS